jgi:uncharacterized membrane protein
MRGKTKILLIFVTLVALTLLSVYWATIHFGQPLGVPRYPQSVPGDIELFYTIETVLSTINVALLIILLITYVGIYRKTQSQFTIGLIVFSAIFLLNVLASNPVVRSLFGFRGFGLGPFAMLPDLFTCIALILLLYLTLKY